MFRHILAAVVAAAASSASAQSASTTPLIDYRSAFDGYRPWSTEPLRDWREVNDEVGRLGGHAGHLRGSLAPAIARPSDGRSPPAPAAAPSTSTPSPPAHRHVEPKR